MQNEALQTIWTRRWRFVIILPLIFFFAQMLYIGFIGSIQTLSWTLLFFISVAGAYYLVRSSDVHIVVSEKSTEQTHQKSSTVLTQASELKQEEAIISAKPSIVSPEDLKLQIELKAHQEGVLMSEEGIKIISHSPNGALELLDTLIKQARMEYPRLDGWTVLNRERIEAMAHVTGEKEEGKKTSL